jgi:hypothetical protein
MPALIVGGRAALIVSGLAALIASISIGSAARKRIDKWGHGYF